MPKSASPKVTKLLKPEKIEELLKANPVFKFRFVKDFEIVGVEAVEASEGVEAVEATLAISHKIDDVVELTESQALAFGDSLEKVSETPYHLEVSVNDLEYKGQAVSLEQALTDFVNSPDFPFSVKTRVVIKYGTETVERQRVLHVPAARRLFNLISTKPSALEMWGNKFESDLTNLG